MAKSRDLQRLLQYQRSQAPKPGMFSTLDELIEASPRENMSPTEWMEWLQSGRILTRDGTQFPLKKAELQDTGLREYLEDVQPADIDEAGRVNRSDLQYQLQGQRPILGETYGVPGQRPYTFTNVPDETGAPTRTQTTKLEYSDPRYQHESSGSTYEESVTRLEGLAEKQMHYPDDTVSWSRTTTHELPRLIDMDTADDVPPVDQGRVRLVEEIQSDVHQLGRKEGYQTDELRAERERISPALQDLYTKYGDADDFPPEGRAIWDRVGVIDEILTEGVSQDVPFKDPKEYGRVELSKQLINAAENDEQYLALTRGADQIERYAVGLNDRSRGGMEHIYDKIYLSALRALARRYGAQMTEVNVPVKATSDSRLHSVAETGSENVREMRWVLDDFIESGDADEWMGVADSYKEVLGELDKEFPWTPQNRPMFEDAQRKVNTVVQEIESIAHEDTVFQELAEEGTSLTEEAFEDRFNIRSNNPNIREDLSMYMDQADTQLSVLEDMYNQFLGVDTTQMKTFPALEITPEVRDKILKVGIPLYGAGAAAIFEEEEPEGFAEGGSVKEDEDDRPARSLLQNLLASLGGAIPFYGEEGAEAGRRLGKAAEYLPAGAMTQWWGINPTTEELEYSGPGAAMMRYPSSAVGYHDMDEYERQMKEFEEWQAGTKAIPGIIDETIMLPALGAMVGLPAPDISEHAMERSLATEEAVLERLGLEEPEGFLENVLYSGGIMGAQAPVPAAWLSRAKQLPKVAEGLERLPSFLTRELATSRAAKIGVAVPGVGLEFFSPIITPKVSNYVAGALFGGTLMTALEPGDEELPPDIEDLVRRTEDGDPEARAILLQLYEEYQEEQAAEERQEERMESLFKYPAGFAKGGSVRSRLQSLLEEMEDNA